MYRDYLVPDSNSPRLAFHVKAFSPPPIPTTSPANTSRKSTSIMEVAGPFRLFDLPPELRLIIYEKYFEGHAVEVRAYKDTILYTAKPKKLQPPSLLLVSKAVSKEAMDVYWSTTRIVIDKDTDLELVAGALMPRQRWVDISAVELLVEHSAKEGHRQHHIMCVRSKAYLDASEKLREVKPECRTDALCVTMTWHGEEIEGESMYVPCS